jgi:hypothetical protein
MATYSKHDFSASVDGKGIAITATATAGTLIHEASATATTYDEIWIYATNTHTADEILVLEWGVAGAGPANYIYQTITSKAGLVLVVPGLILQGNATELLVNGFNSGGASGRINVFGYVNRITA